MKVLWLCNIMPYPIAKHLGLRGTNKEGWISGMSSVVSEHEDISLAFAFPYDHDSLKGTAGKIAYHSFYEDSSHPEIYSEDLYVAIDRILNDFKPDVIHCFGTEYAHTKALLKNEAYRDIVLVHLQGLMKPIADAYYASLPESIIYRRTFRDILRKDSIVDQKRKTLQRAKAEQEILQMAKNVCGRTGFDENYVKKVNPNIKYFKLNETLREQFYSDCWDSAKAKKHSLFVSQGNYPIKGAHFAIKAMAAITDKYPDATMYIAGDNITGFRSLKEKIKISGYGKYLRDLIIENNLEEHVFFTGSLTADEFKSKLLSSEVFLLSSVMENSPNSLGEAMLLGVPCVCSKVGGVSSLATDSKEVLMYKCDDVEELVVRITHLFEGPDLEKMLAKNARERAFITHDRETNYQQMLNIYKNIQQ